MMGRQISAWALGLLVLGGLAGVIAAAGPNDADGPCLFPAAEGPSLTGAPATPPRPAERPPVKKPALNLWRRLTTTNCEQPKPSIPAPVAKPIAPARQTSHVKWVAAQPATSTNQTVTQQLLVPPQRSEQPRTSKPVVSEAPKGVLKSPPRFGVPAEAKPLAPSRPVEVSRVIAPRDMRSLPGIDRLTRTKAVSVEARSPATLPTASPMAGIPLTTDPITAQPFTAVAVVNLPVPASSPPAAARMPTVLPPALVVSDPATYPGTSPALIAPVVPAGSPAETFAANAPATAKGTGNAKSKQKLVDPDREGWWLPCSCVCGRAMACSSALCNRALDCSCLACNRALDCSCLACDRCFDCYDQFTGQGGQFTASVGVMILVPKFGNNPAFNSATFAGPLIHSQQNDFDFGAQAAPRVTLGFVSGSGLGARVGWWGFGIGNGQASIAGSPAVSAAPLGLQANTIGAGPVAILATGSHLQLNVWDFEATECWQCGCWSLLGTAGLRYAHLGQGYIASVYGPGGANLQNLSSGHNFDGVGPTVSLGGKRHLGNTPFYFYGTGRGSLLFGSTNGSALLTGPTALAPSASFSSSDAIMPVAAMELGFGYYRTMFQRTRFFAETGLITQAWFNAGNSSGSLAAPGSPFNTTYCPNGNTLGLIGVSLRCGVNF